MKSEHWRTLQAADEGTASELHAHGHAGAHLLVAGETQQQVRAAVGAYLHELHRSTQVHQAREGKALESQYNDGFRLGQRWQDRVLPFHRTDLPAGLDRCSSCDETLTIVTLEEKVPGICGRMNHLAALFGAARELCAEGFSSPPP